MSEEMLFKEKDFSLVSALHAVLDQTMAWSFQCICSQSMIFLHATNS